MSTAPKRENMKNKIFIILALVSSSLFAEPVMPPIKYLLYFKTYNSICIAKVNDIETFAFTNQKGPIVTSVNIAPFLINGRNRLSVQVGGLGSFNGDYTYPSDATCELTVVAVTKSGEQTEIAKLISSSDDSLNPTGVTSPIIKNSPVTENPVEGTIVYNIERNFYIDGIPDWAWTKAERFEPTPENMEKLIKRYDELRQIILNKDENLIKQLGEIAFTEKEAAEGLGSDNWFNSLFKEKLPKIATASPVDLDAYELLIANDGRLVKLDDLGFSPLVFLDENGKVLFSYAPYFSLINGELVITR